MVHAIRALIIAVLISFSGPVCAADALLPVTLNLVRCVTQAERINMCDTRQLCCDFIEPKKMVVSNAKSEWTQADDKFVTPQNKAENIAIE